MKKLLFTLLVTFIGFNSFAQTLPPIANVKMVTKEDFRANDSLALQVANYMLGTPSEKNNGDRLSASKFLIDWMQGSPDYTFSLDQNILQYFEKNTDLMGVYMASMTAVAIQNKSGKDSATITLNAIKKFIAYIDNSANNVAMTGKLRKLSAANKKGELVSFLKL